jgi:hypothetical protein
MSQEDWLGIQSSLNWGKEGIINFDQFLKKTYKE